MRCSIKPDRIHVLDRFRSLIINSDLGIDIHVAVVGGSKKDMELQVLHDLQKNVFVTTFGIEDSDQLLDLNHFEKFITTFDLVLCSHVLEHVFNLPNCMRNLATLVKPGGYLWINCPTSNKKHGSPEYFSAGYSASMLVKLFEVNNITPIEIDDIGSERNYKYVHMYQRWPSADDLSPSLASLLSLFSKTRSFRILSELLRAFEVSKWSKEIQSNSLFSTETYGMGRKLN